MKISLITTVLNEEKTIRKLLDSICIQTLLPDEVIVVDGGSTDNTVSKIKSHKISKSKLNLSVLVKKGNRSVGRNTAVKKALGEIIVCTDSGNTLDKNWVENITKPFKNKKIDVVAGYYRGIAKNIFQKCLIPYALVMPDRLDPKNFLPAGRSIAFKKTIWKKAGGFPEKYGHNEDFVFAHKLKSIKAGIFFSQDAIVDWQPRKNLKQAFIMFFRFAFGDIQSGLYRPKVTWIFFRYSFFLYILFLSFFYNSLFLSFFLVIAIVTYLAWSIQKNYKYVRKIKSFYYLPAIQITSDLAVITGSIFGFFQKIFHFKYLQFLIKNKVFIVITFFYILTLLFTIRWGIPNQNHPYPYHMDEWHQLGSIVNAYRFGTPNAEGSANGTVFHFLLSGLYLSPSILFQLIDPTQLAIDNWQMRERLFIILRLQTVIFGVLSIFLVYKISKLIKVSHKITTFLFTSTPIWLMLSGYFKYDIALMFWILFAIFLLLRFKKKPTTTNFTLSSIPAALAFATKVSALPLFLLYTISFILFHPDWTKKLRDLALGLGLYTTLALLFGIPDTILGKGDMVDYLYTNIIYGPGAAENLKLNINEFVYLIIKHYPLMFGHSIVILFIASLILMLFSIIKKGIKKFIIENKIELFFLSGFMFFLISLFSIGVISAGNRTLVLLPFITFTVALGYNKIRSIKKNVLFFLLFIIFLTQLYETYSWLHIKIAPNPQTLSSNWLKKNLNHNQTIGIENIPIYQNIPDIILKEYYFNESKIKYPYKFRYLIIDAKSQNLPPVVIVTNHEIENELFKKSAKNDLIQRLKKNKYKNIAHFTPELIHFKKYGTEKDFFLAGIIPAPLSITIFQK
jgi:glycosyltransferase involved in cell wall biosynthesis